MRGATGSRPRRCVDVTCGTDGRAHRIDERVYAADLTTGSGRLPALCGRVVVAASLAAPPGRPCPLCEAVAAARPARARNAFGRRRRTDLSARADRLLRPAADGVGPAR